MRYVNGSMVGVVFFLVAALAMAGDLDSPAGPSDSGSAMYTLEDVYNRIDDGTAGTKRSGSFTEPSAGPASTGHDLDDLYDLASKRSRPAKTGQTKCYDAAGIQTSCSGTGQDGDLQKGVSWPSSRWTCYDATPAEVNCFSGSPITAVDNLTGLQWTIDPNLDGKKAWETGLTYCNGLNHGGYSDWRLPNVKELQSLIDYGKYGPALPSGHPFDCSIAESGHYWSTTTIPVNTERAWYVYLYFGEVSAEDKTGTNHVWPVRGGQ